MAFFGPNGWRRAQFFWAAAAASSRGTGVLAFKTKLTPMPASFQGQGPPDPQGGPGDDQGSSAQFGHLAALL
jgi:hypothetical protein